MESVISWWQSEDSLFTKVEALLVFCTLLFAIQVIFGWWRRCSSNVFIKYALWLAYTFTPVVATYTLGLISSVVYPGHILKDLPHKKSNALRIQGWTLILAIGLVGSTYSMTAYDVDDNKQYTRYLARYLLNTYAVARLFTGNLAFAWVICFVSLLWPQCSLSTFPNMIASSYISRIDLHLQDYMKNEHLQSTGYDPVTMEGYNYVIITQMRPSKPVITAVSQVWQSKEGILGSSGSDGIRLKEVCLSYALSHLLRRRFFGVACPEANIQKTHDLVFRGLLSNVEDNYHAAYRIIETELAFTHDHFFTTNPSFGFLILFFPVGRALMYLDFFIGNIWVTEDKHITIAVILLVLSALELFQLYMYLSSSFLKVVLASRFITPRKRSICSQILRVCNKLPQLFGCWQNKIGQHSLLKDLHKRSITADVIGSLSLIIFALKGPSAFPRYISNPGIKGADRTRLTYRVKKAIALTLKTSDGRLSNGTSSLERNGQVQLSQEFLLGGHASDLLIWHIATEYCDMAQSIQAVRQDDFASSNRDVAARLSSYCAYLMAFVPELLPDDQLETMAMFHRARKEALKHLQGDTTLRAKYTKLRNYGEPSQSQQGGNTSDGNGQPPPQNEDMNDGQPPQENENNMTDGQLPPQDGNNIQYVNVFEKGIQLGKRLEGIPDNGTRWKILADFWTEMILYIAPSNNARDHIQHLANGGEFITHLWALLTHAGILERPPQNVVNVQNATEAANRPDQEETNASGSQEADGGNLPDQGNYDSNASTSIDHRPRVGIV